MRRNRLRAALLVVVAAALAGIGHQVSRTVTTRRTHSRFELTDFLPDVAQRIRNFHRLKVSNGKTVWEITAEDAKYFEKQDEVVIREPRMTLFLSDGNRQAHIRGSEGRLTLQDKEVRAIQKQMKQEAPKIRVEFAVGESVRVVDGPFTDFHGKVDEINPEKGKLKVLVNMFGRETPVELDLLQVEKVH